MTIVEKVDKYIREKNLISAGDRVAVAYSGGVDSLAMTLILQELAPVLGFSIVLFHVNHHLRGAAADADASAAAAFGEAEGLETYILDVYPAAYARDHRGVSVEEAARVLRYRALAEGVKSLQSVPGRTVVACAHHMEDAVETFLFRIARGTGPAGADGLQAKAVMPEGEGLLLIRPVLSLTKEELSAVVAASPYEARPDATNADDSYSRNRIRHQVLPALSAVNEQALSHILSFAEKCRAEHEYIEGAALAVPGLLTGAGRRLDRSALSSLQPPLAEAAVRCFLKQNLPSVRDVGEAQIRAIIGICANEKGPGKTVDLPGGYAAVTDYTSVRIEKAAATAAETKAVEVKADAKTESKAAAPGAAFLLPLRELEAKGRGTVDAGEIILKCTLLTGKAASDLAAGEIPRKIYTKYLDYDTINADVLCLRHRRAGDTIRLSADAGTPLRRYFINEKIPREERDSCFLLTAGSEVLWVIGGRIGAGARLTDATSRVLKIEALVCDERRKDV